MRIGRLQGRYDPHIIEGWVKEFWINRNIYRLVKEKNRAMNRVFNFIDGPPYASGDMPHIGHGWNKTLKDIVLRYMRMKGLKVDDRPGYDCHGLPIEVEVEKRLGIRLKKEIERIGVENFINECKRLALRNSEMLTKWFMELGVFMDWENPYFTLTDNYIESGWWLIKRIDEKGLLEREYRVVYWCPRCSTTLAEYEVEYREIEDPSIYVKFPIKGRDKWFLLIWTTTPWTLPANTFIMIKPSARYVAVEVNGEFYVLAKDRLNYVFNEIGVREYRVVEEYVGSELLGLRYEHPLKDLIPLQEKLEAFHEVVGSEEYVTLIEGTGLVHGAPGHGFEDYDVARRIGLSYIASPIDDEGVFTAEAGKYQGKFVREANIDIIRDLEAKGMLLHKSTVKHKYPVCWRCKTPVVMRATLQWVIKVTKLKEKLLEEIGRVNWVPNWGYERIKHMIDNLQDWVISRQRYWGIPLPIWLCSNNHRLVVGSKEELVKHGGWIPPELHRPWIDAVTLKCPVCGREMKRVPDVADVWFDSSLAFFAPKENWFNLKPEELVLDFIVEGPDQFRGWYFSLLRAGVLGFGRVPYRNVLTHGMVLDEKGREMHKSLGNYVSLSEAIAKTGRDAFRLGVVENTVWEDIKFSWKTFDEIKRDLGVVWNVFVFASTYMHIDGFNPVEDSLEKYLKHLKPEDKWILSRINTVARAVTENLDKFLIHEAAKLIHRFMVEDVSHWYIRLIRRRIWVEENNPDKFAAYATLFHVLYKWLIIASPFIPFITEKIYQEVFKPALPNSLESIHLHNWVEIDEEYINPQLEREFDLLREIYEASASARMKAGIKLRHPIKRLTVYTENNEVKEVVEKYRDLLIEVCNVKVVETKSLSELSGIVRYSVKPNYRSLGQRYRGVAKELFKLLEERGDDIAREILMNGYCKLSVNNIEVELSREDVSITPIYVEGYSVVERKWGSVAIDTKLSIDELSEGLARDVVRRIQVMRKELNLDLNQKIRTYIHSSNENLSLISKHVNYIARETNSITVELIEDKELIESIDGYRKHWDIDDELFIIVVKV